MMAFDVLYSRKIDNVHETSYGCSHYRENNGALRENPAPEEGLLKIPKPIIGWRTWPSTETVSSKMNTWHNYMDLVGVNKSDVRCRTRAVTRSLPE